MFMLYLPMNNIMQYKIQPYKYVNIKIKIIILILLSIFLQLLKVTM